MPGTVADWSTTAASNISINGIDIGEGCAAAGINNAIRELMAEGKAKYDSLDAAILAIAASGIASFKYATVALMNADLAHAAGTIAFVYADPTPTNNDIYAKSGASGSGSWSATGILSAMVTGIATPLVTAAAATAAAAAAINDTRALLAALPRGALGIWPVDRLSGGVIPNVLDSSSNMTATGSVTAGEFSGTGTIPLSVTPSRFTVTALVKVTASNAQNVILYDQASHTNFAFQSSPNLGSGPGPARISGFDVMRAGAIVGISQGQRGGLFNLPGKGYHTLTYCQDATSNSLWIDDVELYTDIEAYTFAAISNFVFGKGPNGVTSPQTYAGFLGLWDRALSDSEIRNINYQQKARVAPNAIIPNGLRTDRFLIIDGDSNHGSNDANCWPWQFAANDSPEVFGAAYGISGSVLANLVARAPVIDALIPPDTYGRKFIMTVGVGTNDFLGLNTTTAATVFIPGLRAYMMARKAAGYLMALFTIPARGDITGATLTNFDAVRAIVNADILANPTLYGLASVSQVIDIGSVAHIGSTFDATYYNADKLHFNATGGALVESIARPVINAM